MYTCAVRWKNSGMGAMAPGPERCSQLRGESAASEYGHEFDAFGSRINGHPKGRACCRTALLRKAAHLGSWALYSAKFMGYYTKKPPAFQRGPNGAEAEEADRTCLAEVFGLCFNGATMDNALRQVVVERDMLRNLLGPQPKAWKAEKADASQTKGKKGHEPDGRSLPPVKRVRNGECWRWLDGKCKSRRKVSFPP